MNKNVKSLLEFLVVVSVLAFSLWLIYWVDIGRVPEGSNAVWVDKD